MNGRAVAQLPNFQKLLSTPLLALIISIPVTATAQVSSNYYKVQDTYGASDPLEIHYVNSDPLVPIVIQSKNLCPLAYHGGSLYWASESRYVTKGLLLDDDLYADMYESPSQLYSVDITGSPISWRSDTIGGPAAPPSVGATYTYNYNYRALLHIQRMSCYYSGCPAGQNCSMSPTEITAMNIDKTLDVKIDSVVIEQPLGVPVKIVDGKPVIAPNEFAYAVVTISGSNFFPEDPHPVWLSATYNGVQDIPTSFPMSDLANGPIKQIRYIPGYLYKGFNDVYFSFQIGKSFGDNLLYEDDISNNSIVLPVTYEAANEVEIEDVQLAQVVFDPVVEDRFGGTEPALVSGKAFAAQLTLSAHIAPEYVNSIATAQIYIDDNAIGEAVDFKPSDISDKRNLLFLYAKTDLEDEHRITVKIHSKSGPIPFVLDSENEIKSNPINRKFYRTQLNLLVGQITGCSSGVSCFDPPTTSDIAMYNGDQRTLAAQLLPVAPSNITYKEGAPITDSSPSGLLWWARLKDFLKMAKIKHQEKQDAAIYLVNDSYMRKMGLELLDEDGMPIEIYGYTLTPLHVGYVDARTRVAFTHELFHALGRAGHSSEVLPAGVNADIRRVYELVPRPLADNFTVFRANNLMLSSPPTREGDEYTVDHSSYGRVFYSMLHKGFDPNIIYVTGIIDENGKAVWSEHTRMESILDEQTGTEIEIRGLDSGGHIVTSALTAAITSAEKLGSNGATIDEFPGYAFAATLIDPGNIAQVQVIKAGKVVSVSNVTEAKTIREIVDKLTKSDFKSSLFAAVELKILKDEVSSYLKLIEKKRKIEAKATLVLLKLSAALSLKSSFVLSDGTTMTLSDLLKKVDAEIKSIK
jgi:hypothetical protein